MREQLFYAWRSFHYDKNSEIIDVYVNTLDKLQYC